MESSSGICSPLLIYYPLSWIMRTQLNEFPLRTFTIYDNILLKFCLHPMPQTLPWSLLPRTLVMIVKHYFFYRCWGHPEDFDSGSCQHWWCGLSGVGVKATSDPWLTWRTPTITTVSSEKRLCGCVQSLESTSHITASAISHWANGGANISIIVNTDKATYSLLSRGSISSMLQGVFVFLHHPNMLRVMTTFVIISQENCTL